MVVLSSRCEEPEANAVIEGQEESEILFGKVLWVSYGLFRADDDGVVL